MIDSSNQAIARRLGDFLTQIGHNPNSLAKKLGYKRSSTIYNAVSGSVAPNTKLWSDIATAYPNLDFNWLLKGSAPAPQNMGGLVKEVRGLRDLIINLPNKL
jgi:hypothetical protein